VCEETANPAQATATTTVARGERATFLETSDLLGVARYLVRHEGRRSVSVGFIGYGPVRRGDRILLAVDTEFDLEVVGAMATALREAGAFVDVVQTTAEPDREFEPCDEIRVSIRRGHWLDDPRRWEGLPRIERLAEREGYDLLIHGKGGPIPRTAYRYEHFPWLGREHFLSRASTFPNDVHLLVNNLVWERLLEDGPGGSIHLTDPEGTDLRYSLLPGYFDGRHSKFGVPDPVLGHLHLHPLPPFLESHDTRGVIAGTTSHFERAFPRIELEVEGGVVQEIRGGGAYGDGWRALLEETRSILYPGYPRPGMFWPLEVALGTNPKICRPSNVKMRSSGGFEWERRRAGVIHVGVGTAWRSETEQWAAANQVPYGHLHVHLLFPTMVLTTAKGRDVTLVRDGHITALDDPRVRELAAAHGDPDELLALEWVPRIPGISCEGSYADYAADPARYIYAA